MKPKTLMLTALSLAPQLLLMLIGAYDQAAIAAGGLVGAAVDPAFGQANEIGMMGSFGYDTARDISRVATAFSTIPCSWAGCKIIFGHNDGAVMNPVRYVLTGLSVGFGGPISVHLLGTFAINNFGGLGGGL
jgi:hypothetical protein